ncbi:LegC family aminotransferase [Lishizhenia sp.]|uniref:LegC family aminotransferase n=1 Tax=Lishizhenia sp. TaxID=2497594 RepID=UPI00299EDDD3|nr:LegC family aminotransferase [Lishizhenia sp.]MDX1446807.1 LegC family aminotransferase [Lishizhenia sp.]
MIPLSIPQLEGNEWKYVKDCIDTGWISSAGSYVNQFEQMVADYAGAKYGVACMNGTVGLHIAQILSGVTQDDHVLVPNITFIATLNAVKYTGATPILVDVNADNWQMDLDLLDSYLNENTIGKEIEGIPFSFLKSTGKRVKAIMPVHVLGNMGDMARLVEICEKYHLDIIEDSTEALGSTFNGKHAGTFGKFGVFSFNGNKIISTGGGGVIVTNDKDLADKAKHLTTQAKVSAMDYIHDEIGYNYRLVNVLAAIGVAQMETFPKLLENKRQMDAFYRQELEGVGDIVFQSIDEEVNPNCWLFTFKTSKMRDLLAYLNENGVQSRPFWMPMNQLEMFKEEIYVSTENVSSKIYDTSISIPSSAGITLEQQKTVVETIKEFYKTQE